MSTYKKLTTVGCAAVLAFGLAACGNGDDDRATMPEPPPPPTPPHACDAGASQACVAARQGELDALGDDATVGALDAARMALADAQADLAAANAAAHRRALVAAATCTAGTQACVDAHRALVDALAADDTTSATDLAAARTDLASVQMAKAEADAAAARVAADTGTVNDAIAAATAAIAALTATSSADEVQAARDLVTAARTALDGVQNLSADRVATLQATIDAIDTANLEAQQTRIAAAQEQERMAAETVRVAAATAAAGTKEDAIETEAAQAIGGTAGTDGAGGADAGLGGSARTDATESTAGVTDDVYRLSIGRDRDGTEIEVTDPANAGDDDPKFSVARMLSHGRQMLTRTMEADDDGNVMEEVVLVRTDIEEPRAVEFAKVAGQALNADLDPATDADNDGISDNELTALWVGTGERTDDGTQVPSDAVRILVRSAAFAPGPGDSVTHTFARFQLDGDTGTDGNQTVRAFTTPGTYNGAEGTYRCGNNLIAADCTVTVDHEGAIAAMSMGWVFIPDAGATSDVPDSDYLHYGFWLKRTTDADGVLEYNEVETVAGSSVAATGNLANPYTVRGTATYEGGATGVYVHAVVDPDGTRASATSGHFNADAELTATFGQTVDNPATTGVNEAGTIAPAMLNSIAGTIDNFDLSGHDTGPGWSVSLEQGAIAPGTGLFSGVAKGGGADGSYSGTFHGPVGDHDTDSDTPDIPHPDSVAGEFNASFSNGSVAGAFGASKR